MNELAKLGLWLVFGMAIGSVVMIYHYESQAKPAPVVESAWTITKQILPC